MAEERRGEGIERARKPTKKKKSSKRYLSTNRTHAGQDHPDRCSINYGSTYCVCVCVGISPQKSTVNHSAFLPILVRMRRGAGRARGSYINITLVRHTPQRAGKLASASATHRCGSFFGVVACLFVCVCVCVCMCDRLMITQLETVMLLANFFDEAGRRGVCVSCPLF